MKNPWIDLPKRPPFVLPRDAPYIDAFNRSAPRTTVVDTELMPGPFLGDPGSPVVILALNPGWGPRDRIVNRDARYRRRVRVNLEHRPVARPFMPLDGDPKRPGARWWRRNLKHVLNEVGEECAGRNLLCLEYFPYHSRSFAHGFLRLPSQDYTFELLRRALARRAVVVVTRGARLWEGAVPELAHYRWLARTTNARSASISPRNCGPSFTTIVGRLRASAM